MELLIKAAVVGLVGALLALTLKKSNPELALLLAIGVGAVVLGLALELYQSLRETVESLQQSAALSSAILAPVLKCVGLGIITRLAADLCKDAGQGGIGSAVELTGAVAAVYVSLPLLQTFLQMIGEFL